MTKYIAIASLLFATGNLLAFDEKTTEACCNPGSNRGEAAATVLAQVDGVKLTLADYERKHPAAMFQARNTFYESQRKAVEEFISEYLLDRQAQKEHLTVAELLELHVNKTIAKAPSDEALRLYYESVDTNESFDVAKPKILDYVMQRRISKAKTAYLQSLKKEANIEFLLASPRAQVALGSSPRKGPADAPVVLVEFADYECPYCQTVQTQIDKLQTEFSGKLAFVYKDLPLPMHANAQKAAEAAHCAGAQGKFWEYHDLLFTGKQLEVPKLKESARSLNLDVKAFEKCLDGGDQAAVVKAHLAEGQELGIPGTPAFFVNGRALNGAADYETLRKVIEEEIRAISKTKTTDVANR